MTTNVKDKETISWNEGLHVLRVSNKRCECLFAVAEVSLVRKENLLIRHQEVLDLSEDREKESEDLQAAAQKVWVNRLAKAVVPDSD